MIDARTAGLLQTVFRREARSLLQYIGDAFPWTTSGERAGLYQLQEIVHEEAEGHTGLARFLERNRVPLPYPGSYPMAFTTLNFVSLDSLIPRLIDAQKRGIAVLETDLSQIQDATCRGTVEGLLEIKRRHLKLLESMIPSRAAPVPA